MPRGKGWTNEDETTALQIREQHEHWSWDQVANEFNARVPFERYRTVHAVRIKVTQLQVRRPPVVASSS